MIARLELAVALVLLAVAAALSAVFSAAWLTAYIAGVPVPLTIGVALLFGLALVRVARQWSDSTVLAVFPSAVFVLTIVALDLGPGGDMPVPLDLRGLGLVVAGGLVPMWVAAFSPPPARSRGGAAPRAAGPTAPTRP